MSPLIIASIIIFLLLLFLLTGLPIAFCLLGLSVIGIAFFIGPSCLPIIVNSAFSQLRTEVFIAIPMFVLMATLLQYSGIGTSLYKTVHKWAGPLPGSLGVASMLTCSLLAAMSGVGATGTVVTARLGLPEMMERKYHPDIAMGCVTSGGALGPIIPPSNLMIIAASYTGISVGALFMAGVIPGIIITFISIIYIVARGIIQPTACPPIPVSERASWQEKFRSLGGILGPGILILAVLGTIYTGIATPTEASGVGAFGAAVFVLINKEFTYTNIKNALFSTAKINAMIMWLVIGGGGFSSLLTVTRIGDWLTKFILEFQFSFWGIIGVEMVIVLILGMIIDPVAICMICLPVFVPISKYIGADPLWVTTLFVIASTIGYITPPFGLNLFYMKGALMGTDYAYTPMSTIYRAIIPFVIAMLITLILCIVFPPIITYLPSLVV